MENSNIYQDIAKRTNGDIYVGVVGPVRTGKSTFIKRFMETLVLPNIEGEFRKERAVDELPQSAAGKTIMTTEPKFIPEEAVQIVLENNAKMNVRLIDCVGYIVPSSLGYIENEMPRMVATPWFEEEIPFNMAAEIGTQKVISEHSTIGLVVTTDGSISDIPREEYQEAEERVINELKEINKPFIVLLNCQNPYSPASRELAEQMSNEYSVTVLPINCLELSEEHVREVLKQVLFEFTVKEVNLDIPRWVAILDKDHWLKEDLFNCIKNTYQEVTHVWQMSKSLESINECENIVQSSITNIDLGTGSVNINIQLQNDLFYRILGEKTELEINSESDLMSCIIDLAQIKKKYDKISGALEEVEATGYGIVMPAMDELTLEEPEIIKQGGKYGVRLRAEAPSIHMMKANISAEVSPIVGSEKQSEDLIMYLLNDFEESPEKLWESNIFGKSLHELVNEDLHSKLYHMPAPARQKLQETIERIINEGCGGLICIIL